MADTPTFPLREFLGMSITDDGGGNAHAEVVTGPAHHNPHGYVHGAVVFTMVDTSMGAAVMGILGAGQTCSTIDLDLRFLRPVRGGRLSAATTVVKAGRTLVHLESRVTDDDGRLVATATSVFAVIGEAAPQTPARQEGSDDG